MSTVRSARQHRRQGVLAGRDPGDRERVTRIALAGHPRPASLSVRELGWHLPHRRARGDQEPCSGRAISRAALDADTCVPGLGADPLEQRLMRRWIVPERSLGDGIAEPVDHTRSQAVLVRIDAHRDPVSSLHATSTMARAGTGRCALSQSHAPVKPRPVRRSRRQGHLSRKPTMRLKRCEPPTLGPNLPTLGKAGRA